MRPLRKLDRKQKVDRQLDRILPNLLLSTLCRIFIIVQVQYGVHMILSLKLSNQQSETNRAYTPEKKKKYSRPKKFRSSLVYFAKPFLS